MNQPAQLGSRALFPELRPSVYANHAAISPLSMPVVATMHRAIADYAAHGIAAITPWAEDRNALRQELANFFDVEAHTLGFVQNTTTGVRAVALGIPWQVGDRILIFDGEFPANVTPWERAAALYGLELVSMPVDRFRLDPEGAWADYQRHLDGGIRLVAVSLVQFQTGFCAPVPEMSRRAHSAGAEFFVDGIQAAGSMPVSLAGLDVDYFCGGGRKWMMGPEGAGYLYVHDRCVEQLRPVLAGWLSHENPLDFLGSGPGLLKRGRPIRRSADFVEGAALNVVGYAGLRASLRLISELGAGNIFAHIQKWHNLLEAALVERGFRSLRAADPAGRSGILSFLPPADLTAASLASMLMKTGISAGNPDGVLRFAPHWPSSLEEPELVVEAISKLPAHRVH